MTANGKPRFPLWTESWRADLLSSLVVFLVALPLCMGIALASGAPIAAGLVTGIIGGIVVGLLAGAPLQVSGPAAGLTVICGEIIREHGMPALGIAVLMAGMLQLAAGLMKFGQWFRAVSPAVIHGMLSGIGVLILSSQIHVMVDDRPRENGLANIASIPEAIWKGLPLPELEVASVRLDRTEFLQIFGRLHERQSEIEALVARGTTQHGTARQHQLEAERLAGFGPRQREIAADLGRVVARLEASPVARADGDRAEALMTSIRKAQREVNLAANDLVERRFEAVEASQSAASRALVEVLANLKSHDWAAKVGLLSIAVIIFWQSFAPRRLKLIPGPLLAVMAATLLAWALSLPVLYVEVPDRLIDGLTFPTLNVLQDVPFTSLLMSAVMLAVIASAETLLCASAVDKMHSGPRTNYDKELAAQGIGNMLCGLAGALPMTGVIVRSAANVQAGARSNLSAILHGIWLLTFVVFLTALLRIIPTCALAGILVFTGFRLIDWKGFWHLWKYSRSEAAIFLVTVVVIVVEDLLIGVVTGIVLSAIKLLVTFSHLDVTLVDLPGGDERRRVQLKLSGAATFLRLPVLAAKLDEVPQGAELHADLEHLEYVDHACLDLLMSWARQHESAGGRLVIDWGQLHGRFRGEKRGTAKESDSERDNDSERDDKPEPAVAGASG
jgi:MFS superfamily sulfate permease-like transporter